MTTARLAAAALLAAVVLASAGCPDARYRRPEVKLTEPGCNEAPDRAVLGEIRKKVTAARDQQRSPIVVFDLDDTLVDTATRARAIFIDALRSPSAPTGADEALEQLDYLCLDQYVLDVEGNLDRAGFTPGIRRYLQDAWSRVALTDRYLDRQVPFPGAAAWVADLRARGATIVYLTNRNARRLREGTVRALDTRGFPGERDGALLIMQPGDHEDSLSWKQDEAERLVGRGTVVATFENEPANVRMYRTLYPEATHVLMVSRHRPKQEKVPEGTRCIVDYKDER
jgi:hypothetical protein